VAAYHWQLRGSGGRQAIIDCTNPLILLLPPNPVFGAEVELTKYAGNATVSIDTNGLKFNGSVPVNLHYADSSFFTDTSDKLVYVNNTIGWISTRKQVKLPLILTYVSNGDGNGLVYYLGTNGITSAFVNPTTNDKLSVVASSNGGSPDLPTALTDRQSSNWFTDNIANSWVAWDTIASFAVSEYTLVSRIINVYYPRTWVLEGTNVVASFDIGGINAATWTTIDSRTNDNTLNGLSVYSTFTANGSTAFYRYIRLRQTGLDSSNTNYLVLGEVEFYGTLLL
jgi:hypothetical protein